jgi:epoxyqueuosine reductase QueG
MTEAKQSSMRMTEQTRLKINALIEAGHSSTITGIIEVAVDRMYQDELVRGQVRDIVKKSGGWQVT